MEAAMPPPAAMAVAQVGIDGGSSGGDSGDDGGGAGGGDGSDGGDDPLNLSTGMAQSGRSRCTHEGSSDVRAMRGKCVRGSKCAP